MNNLSGMVWIELRKAIRSRMPLWTALGALCMPLAIAFLIFIAKHPEISQKLGLISAKAELMEYAAADWSAYLVLYALMLAAVGFFLFCLVISWVFGREFIDGALKDMLAVPVPRASILMAKFIVVIGWSAMLSLVMFIAGMLTGALIGLPGGSLDVFVHGSVVLLTTAGLVVAVVIPFAFFASVGRGYLLPLGLAVLALMMANLAAVIGFGAYFPWAVPGLYAQGNTVLPPDSYWIVVLTALAGMLATYYWWKYADQSR